MKPRDKTSPLSAAKTSFAISVALVLINLLMGDDSHATESLIIGAYSFPIGFFLFCFGAISNVDARSIQ